MTAVLEDLRALTDLELADVYDRAADDDAAAGRAVLGELGRRDGADRAARARDVLAGIRHEAEVAVHAQYLAASEACCGRLLSRDGMAAGVAEWDLWRMPERDLQRFASEELLDHFMFVQPRLTVAAYIRQHAAESRAARIEALDQAGAGASDEITEGITDDQLAGIETRPISTGICYRGSSASRRPRDCSAWRTWPRRRRRGRHAHQARSWTARWTCSARRSEGHDQSQDVRGGRGD